MGETHASNGVPLTAAPGLARSRDSAAQWVHGDPDDVYVSRTRLIDRNLIPNFIAFCATAPRVRPSFFAACGCDNFAFANARRFFTFSFDHAEAIRRFLFAIDAYPRKNAHHTPPKSTRSDWTYMYGCGWAGEYDPNASYRTR
jgi:hypothetical protein